MKIQVRQGCFETNSSSTHSLQLIHNDIDYMINVIDDRHKSHLCYSDEFSDDTLSERIVDNKLVVRHLNLIYSDYSKSYFYVFKSFMSKVLFVGMLYFGLHKKFFDSTNMSTQEIVEKMKEQPLFEKINNIILKEIKKRGYKDVTIIDWNPKRFINVWSYAYNEKWNNLFKKKTINEKQFITIVNRIFKNDFSVAFWDIADFECKKITYVI